MRIPISPAGSLLWGMLCAGACAPAAEPAAGADTAESSPSVSTPPGTSSTTSSDPGSTPSTTTTPSTSTSTAPEPSQVVLQRSGEATVDADGYLGEETWQAIEDSEDDRVLCALRYRLSDQAVRTDCSPASSTCEWAFDLVISEVEVVTDLGDCGALLALDGHADPSLDGAIVAYGYGVLAGHLEVLLVDLGKGWETGGYAQWDGDTGHVVYDTVAEFHEFEPSQ